MMNAKQNIRWSALALVTMLGLSVGIVVGMALDQRDGAQRQEVSVEPTSLHQGPLEGLLDQIVRYIIENADRQQEFYGTPGDNEIVLVNTYGSVPWPSSYAPREISGWRLIPDRAYERPAPDELMEHNKKLGLRIDLLAVNKAMLLDQRQRLVASPVSVTLYNVGGYKNEGPIGGAHFGFAVKPDKDGWQITLRSAFD